MAGVGLPCATCRIYYAVDLKRCPVCQKENRARPQGAEKEQEMSSRVAILVAKAEADAAAFALAPAADLASEEPSAANGKTWNRLMTQMKMKSPYRCFEKFDLVISGPPPQSADNLR